MPALVHVPAQNYGHFHFFVLAKAENRYIKNPKMSEDAPDLENNESEKEKEANAQKNRKILKWAVAVSIFTLLAIIAVVIPMALKAVDKTQKMTDSLTGGDNIAGRPNIQPSSPPSFSIPTISSSPSMSNPPSMVPTMSSVPTLAPSSLPSTSPTSGPTFPLPSAHPTPISSSNPTFTHSPTTEPIDPDYAFKLRLFWQAGYYWQETWDEDYFCVECVECKEYGTGDGWEHDCDRKGNGEASDCEKGDMFWIMECEKRGAEFNIVTDPKTGGYQLRLEGTDFCIGRGVRDNGAYKSRILAVKDCDISDGKQLWAPFPYLNKFDLRPLEDAGKEEGEADCISQLHHPKAEEVLSMHSCKLSRIYETRYWEEWD